MPAAPLHADPASIAQLLDEHHLVVLGAKERRHVLGGTLGRYLASLPETLVVEINGRDAIAVNTLTAQIATGLERRRDHGAAGNLEELVSLLRALPPCQRVYFLWQDADAMLEAAPDAFAHAVNAILGIAAERELLSAEDLILERWVFFGNPKLGAYAEDDRGQLRSWLDEDGATPFWDVAAVVERPSVLTVRLDG